MKTIITAIVFILSTIKVYSQTKFATYKCFGDSYDISISFNGSDKYDLYINAQTNDVLYNQGGIIFNEESHQKFLEAFKQAKDKYIEWSETAKKNNVSDFRKQMIMEPSCEAYFKFSTESAYNFDFSVNLLFFFNVSKHNNEIGYYLIVSTGELTSSKADYITAKGFNFFFTNTEEMDAFASLISKEAISKEQLNRSTKEELFKD